MSWTLPNYCLIPKMQIYQNESNLPQFRLQKCSFQVTKTKVVEERKHHHHLSIFHCHYFMRYTKDRSDTIFSKKNNPHEWMEWKEKERWWWDIVKSKRRKKMRIIQFVSREWRENEDKNGFQWFSREIKL